MAINRTQSVFKYKTIKGPLHKLPAMLKLFFLLPFSIFCMSLSSVWLSVGIAVLILAAFLCRFTLREQLTDLKPAFYYALLMYAISVFSNIFEIIQAASYSLIPAPRSLFPNVFLPKAGFIRIVLRLTMIIQLSALLFRSTSPLEIRNGLCSINRRFGESVSLFLCFIPEIFSNWNAINLAWKARGGKNGLAKIKTVVFVLISLSMEKAALKARALEARGK